MSEVGLFVSRKMIQLIKILRCYVTEGGGGGGTSKVVTRRYMGKGGGGLKSRINMFRNLWMAPCVISRPSNEQEKCALCN